MKKAGVLIGKCTALLLVDAAVLLLLFFVWDMAAGQVFPFALLNVLAVMAIVDMTVLFLPYMKTSGDPIPTAGALSAVVLYGAFTLVFTGLTYSWIAETPYLVISAAAFAAYIAVLALLYLAKRRERTRVGMTHGERIDAREVQVLLLEVEGDIHSLQGKLPVRQFDSLCRAFSSLQARVGFSTPFGRSNRLVVLDMEKRIADRLRHIDAKLKEESPEEPGDWINDILSSLMDTSELVKNKEKLLG